MHYEKGSSLVFMGIVASFIVLPPVQVFIAVLGLTNTPVAIKLFMLGISAALCGVLIAVLSFLILFNTKPGVSKNAKQKNEKNEKKEQQKKAKRTKKLKTKKKIKSLNSKKANTSEVSEQSVDAEYVRTSIRAERMAKLCENYCLLDLSSVDILNEAHIAQRRQQASDCRKFIAILETATHSENVGIQLERLQEYLRQMAAFEKKLARANGNACEPDECVSDTDNELEVVLSMSDDTDAQFEPPQIVQPHSPPILAISSITAANQEQAQAKKISPF